VALTINDCVFGRSPRLYLGPYPSIEEATSLLDEQGETPVLRSGQLLLRGGHANYYICPANPLRDGMWIEGSIHRCFCDEFGPNRYSLCVSDIENDYILRVAALDETSLLVDTVDGIQIRWWDGQYLGRIWAEWRTDPPRR
jgi:hypothetical protein